MTLFAAAATDTRFAVDNCLHWAFKIDQGGPVSCILYRLSCARNENDIFYLLPSLLLVLWWGSLLAAALSMHSSLYFLMFWCRYVVLGVLYTSGMIDATPFESDAACYFLLFAATTVTVPSV